MVIKNQPKIVVAIPPILPADIRPAKYIKARAITVEKDAVSVSKKVIITNNKRITNSIIVYK